MGIIKPFEEEHIEIKELRQMLSSCSAVQRRKDEKRFPDQRGKLGLKSEDEVTEKLVCVTSGVSFVGLAIVNRLLLRGYSVRVLVTNEEEMQNLREVAANINGTSMLTAVMADINEVQSLSDAFNGCRGVFHTAAFIDPAGLSGYSKAMVGIELKTCENVMVACSRTSTVRRCVLTSSLLACLWLEDNDDPSSSSSTSSTIVNHHSWSDESVCLKNKLWYALGKLRAEKCAWRIIGDEKRVRLVTICAGLVTGPEFPHRNPTSTFAYLKGVQHMYAKGLLATVDVQRLADAHLLLFEAMENGESFGRYICFDNVVQCQTEADHLARQLGLDATFITGNNPSSASPRFQLSNLKLSRLMMTRLGCNNNNNVI